MGPMPTILKPAVSCLFILCIQGDLAGVNRFRPSTQMLIIGPCISFSVAKIPRFACSRLKYIFLEKVFGNMFVPEACGLLQIVQYFSGIAPCSGLLVSWWQSQEDELLDYTIRKGSFDIRLVYIYIVVGGDRKEYAEGRGFTPAAQTGRSQCPTAQGISFDYLTRFGSYNFTIYSGFQPEYTLAVERFLIDGNFRFWQFVPCSVFYYAFPFFYGGAGPFLCVFAVQGSIIKL